MITDLPILVLGPKYGAWVADQVAFPYSTCKWLRSTSQNSNNISDAGKGTSCKKSTEQRHARVTWSVAMSRCVFSRYPSEGGWKRDGGCGCRIRMGRISWCRPLQSLPAPRILVSSTAGTGWQLVRLYLVLATLLTNSEKISILTKIGIAGWKGTYY